MPRPEYLIAIEPLYPEEGGYVASVPDLPGCMSDGETPAEAAHNVQDAISSWIAEAVALGREIPPPRTRAADLALTA